MSAKTKYIELLSPARDYEAAIAAIDCGADALYIGASNFGARRGATNSTDDIARVVDYAHLFGVKIFVTLNTILYERELKDAEALARRLIEIGVDALIVQDMAYREMNLPVELHEMVAYPFEGYWKDVGTIASLWEANMDLLVEKPELNLSDESWRIYSRHGAEAPQYLGKNAMVSNSSLTAGCGIYGIVRNSVLGPDVVVEEGALVEDSVLMDGVTVRAGATVRYSILDSRVEIGEGATVGTYRINASDVTVVGADVKVPAREKVPVGAMLSEA